MDRTQAKQMGADIEKALQTIADEYNMTMEYRGGSFSDTDYKPWVTFTGKNADGKSRTEKEWELYRDMFGLKKEWLGEKVVLSGKKMTITGLDTKKSKYPVMVETADGHKYKVTPEQIKLMLGGKNG